MEKSIEIIGLIYKSVDYLNFMAQQLGTGLCKADGWDVSYRIIANDANERVLSRLDDLQRDMINFNYTIYNDPNPNEYYLNRVYRCHNFGAQTTEKPNICFVNSDILFAPNWLDNILKHHDGINIPVSRLFESGKMPSGQYGMTFPIGHHPHHIDYLAWFCNTRNLSVNEVYPGGLYGPVVFETQRFLDAGMFPEGNLYADGVGTRNGDVIKSSDDYFFHDVLEQKYGMKHITVFDSLCYHIQEGEKDE